MLTVLSTMHAFIHSRFQFIESLNVHSTGMVEYVPFGLQGNWSRWRSDLWSWPSDGDPGSRIRSRRRLLG